MIHKFDYVFAENGTVQYKDGRLLSRHVSYLTAPYLFYSTSRIEVTPICAFSDKEPEMQAVAAAMKLRNFVPRVKLDLPDYYFLILYYSY